MTNPILDTVGTDFAAFTDADAALARIGALYEASIATLRHAFAVRGSGANASGAVYPYLAVEVEGATLLADTRMPYGVLLEPGLYGTTLTRPDLFASYLREQISLLLRHYHQPVLVGSSRRRIPLPYVIEDSVTDITEDDLRRLSERFALPDLAETDDRIANCQQQPSPGQPRPLSLFAAERVDYSLARLHHYTGTPAADFQRFVLLTNYQRYVEEFVSLGRARSGPAGEYERFVEPDGSPQMPAYHMVRPDGDGVTLVNIGVGPSNAKTLTDHVAVLRPHCWLMLGHCAGLRRTQRLGDYVLAHGYVRDDHVLDDDLPPWVPIPPIAEVQVALQEATSKVTGLRDGELKTRLRTGTVMTTDNRNWELRFGALFGQINMSRSIAVDMESATIAANGFRFRVPYGTLLCVSDKPLHGELKLRGMARAFYRERISQHLHVGIETMRSLREQGTARLHSRKLRGFDEPPFR